MVKTRPPVHSLVLIDASQAVPLWRQIYEQIRAAISSGRLAAGVRLPASRALASDLVVSRNSVTAAYAQLRAEGYLVQRGRVGTFVATLAPDRVEIGRARRAPAEQNGASGRDPAPAVTRGGHGDDGRRAPAAGRSRVAGAVPDR